MPTRTQRTRLCICLLPIVERAWHAASESKCRHGLATSLAYPRMRKKPCALGKWLETGIFFAAARRDKSYQYRISSQTKSAYHQETAPAQLLHSSPTFGLSWKFACPGHAAPVAVMLLMIVLGARLFETIAFGPMIAPEAQFGAE